MKGKVEQPKVEEGGGGEGNVAVVEREGKEVEEVHERRENEEGKRC